MKAFRISTWIVNPCANVGLTKTGMLLQFIVSRGVFTRKCEVDNEDRNVNNQWIHFLLCPSMGRGQLQIKDYKKELFKFDVDGFRTISMLY